MKYRKLDVNGDYVLGAKPDKGFFHNTEAVLQAVVTRLNLLLGEWWEDQDDGLPLFEEIIGQYNDVETVELIITERIIETEGVSNVTDINCYVNADSRQFIYTASIVTVFMDDEEAQAETFSLDFKNMTFVRKVS